MKHLYYLAVALVPALFVTCGPAAQPAAPRTPQHLLQQARGLLGNWRGGSGNEVFGEAWEQRNDSLWWGQGYALAGTDTVSVEQIALVQRGNQLYYEPRVRNQNGGEAVRFTASLLSDTCMVFENPDHDFPQTIRYRLGGDSLVAEISGLYKGQPRSQRFLMGRVH